MENNNKTRVDRYIEFFKNHIFFSVLFVFLIGIVAVSTILNATMDIGKFTSSVFGEEREDKLDALVKQIPSGSTVAIIVINSNEEIDAENELAISIEMTLKKSGNVVIDRNIIEKILEEQKLEIKGSSSEARKSILEFLKPDYMVSIRDNTVRVIDNKSGELLYTQRVD